MDFFSVVVAVAGLGDTEEKEGGEEEDEAFFTSSGISDAVADNVVAVVVVVMVPSSTVSAGAFVRRDLVERSSITGDSSIVFITGDACSVFASIKGVFGGE